MAIKSTILLLIGLVLCELHKAIQFIWPSSSLTELNLFLDRSYNKSISVLWYVYELMNIVNHIIWAYVLVNISGRVSTKMANIGMVFTWYFVAQTWFYVWNRNTSFLNNVCLYICMGAIILFLLKPNRKEGKCISIE